MGYFRDTFKGVTWMGLLRGSTRLIAFVKIAFLARILTPEQFGIFGIAALVLAFLEIFTETGINVFLIQENDDLDEYLDTAYLISIIRGFLISVVLFAFAPFISGFFNAPESKNLILLIAITPLLRGFINPAIVKFQKQLKFNKEFYLRFFIYALDAIVAILFALYFRTASSLIFGMIAGVLAEIIISWIYVSPRPRLDYDIVKLKQVIKRGKWVTISGMMNYLFHQGDDLVVGKFLSSSSLGVYQVAYKLATLPTYETGEVINKVTFPVYTRISSDKVRLKRALIRVTIAVSLVVIPAGLILYIFTNEIVLLVLGESWLEAIPVVRILAIFSVIRAISGSTTSLFLSLKKQEYVSVIMTVGTIVMVVSIFPLINRFGVTGAAYSTIIGSIAAIPFIVWYINKVFKDI